MQKVSWPIQPMAEQLSPFAAYPPVQGGKGFGMSNVVDDFVNQARQ